MTGFGKSEAVYGNKAIRAEIRSVNSKQLDLSVKCSTRYRALEGDIRTLVGRTAKRGKVECSLFCENNLAETHTQINKENFAAYAGQLREAALASGIDISATGFEGNLLQAVLRLPDVVQGEERTADAEENRVVMQLVQEALARYEEFRQQEGAILIEDLLRRVALIEEYMAAIEPYEQVRVERIKQRIRDRITEMKLPLDSARLEQEMIYYIEKLDITEEKVRLKKHCDYFREVAASEEEVGRKLGFIAQEMGREINTTGSKSNEAEMQILVVKMKDELEKIKEQILNLL